MAKYLYGAAVQGIQSFIFQTNKLAEIVGASELVEKICTTHFYEEAGIKEDDENIILNAAGNIKYLCSENECKKLVRNFPKSVMELAPGITVSQAVVKFEEGSLNSALQSLEDRLRAERNKVPFPLESGVMGTERARRTGGIGFVKRVKRKSGEELIDEATHLKRRQSDPYYKYRIEKQSDTLFHKISGIDVGQFDFKKDLSLDIDKITATTDKSWVAVVHADGNGLGKIIQNLNKNLINQSDEKVKEAFKTFSKQIDSSTKEAAQKAFKEIIANEKQDNKAYPVRPVILGGDDLTVIIRADLAFKFTKCFLKGFEEKTKKNFEFLKDKYQIDGFENGITACAGIAYVQKSYPFHYAVDLAERLCGEAKDFVKTTVGYKGFVPNSALSFFKVQDSYIEGKLKDIRNRVLSSIEFNFDYGPYLIQHREGFANVNQLTDKLEVVKKYADDSDKGKTNGVSKLRQWTTEVLKDKTTADFMLERMRTVNSNFMAEIEKSGPIINNGKSIIYDVIQLHSFKKR